MLLKGEQITNMWNTANRAETFTEHPKRWRLKEYGEVPYGDSFTIFSMFGYT